MTYSHSAADWSFTVALNGRSVRSSSPDAPANPIVVHHQPQRVDGTERSRRSWGMCRQLPGADQGKVHVRLAGKGRWPLPLLTLFPSRLGGSLNRFRHFFQFGHQPARQGFADVPESHFYVSNRRLPAAGIKPSEGVVGDAPQAIGEFRNV